ncbi:MAG TPA: hypothetical protein VKU82_12425, partial [Planctomycetaceae bacterium]|nr:hypothetical protein [Planctomycetaceae bacterium]
MSTPTNSQQIEYIDKRKSHINVRLFLTVATTACVLVVLSYFVRKFQLDRNAIKLSFKADEAYEDGKMSAAVTYLSRYLSFRPHDTEALAKLAEWSDETAQTDKARTQAFLRLEQALREDPKRDELRKRAIRLGIKLGRFQDALFHLDYFCKQDGDFCGGDAALAAHKATAHAGLGKFDLAVEWYLHAIELDEDDPTHYVDLVTLIDRKGDQMDLRPLERRFSPQARAADSSEPTDAPDPNLVNESILAAMVRNCQEKSRIRAFLARAVYHRTHGRTEDAAYDITEALTLSPDSGDALLQAIEIELALATEARLQDDEQSAGTHSDAAANYALRGRQAVPDDLRFHLVQSRIEIELGRQEDAEQHLREGLADLDKTAAANKGKTIPKETLRAQTDLAVQLTWSLANVLLTKAYIDPQAPDQDALSEATQKIDRLQRLGGRPALAKFLEARILLGRQSWYEAAEKFKLIRPDLSDLPDAAHFSDLALADCYDRTWNPDSRLQVFRHAVEEDPFWIPGRLGLADSLAKLDKIDEAITEYTTTVRRGTKMLNIPKVPALVARLMIRKQMMLPIEQRRWENVENTLSLADRLSANSVEAVLLRAEMLFQRQKFADAEMLLKSANEKHPDDVGTWTAMASFLLRRSDQDPPQRNESAAAWLDEAQRRLGDRVDLRIAQIGRALKLGGTGRDTLVQLEKNTEAYNDSDRQRLYQELARAYGQLQLLEKSLAYWTRAADESPNMLEVCLAMADVAARIPDASAFGQALKRIRRIEGPEGPNGDFAEASALLARISTADAASNREAEATRQADLDLARRFLSRAEKHRPTWLAIPRALAALEGLRGNRAEAFSHLQHALLLGDRSRETVTEVVAYLYLQRRFDEAHEQIKRIADSTPELLSGELARYASLVAWQQRLLPDAIRYADRLGDDAETYKDLLWQAELKAARGDRETDVDELLKAACEKAPGAPEVWVMRVAYVARSDPKRAEEIIPHAAEKVPADPKRLRPMTLAQCYEALRDYDQAELHYREAAQLEPDDIAMKIELINFFVRSNQREKADVSVDRLLDPAVGAPQSVVEAARRTKAILTASAGSYDDLQKAWAMLPGQGENMSEAASADLRTQATILIRSGLRRDKLRLIQVLEELDRR